MYFSNMSLNILTLKINLYKSKLIYQEPDFKFKFAKVIKKLTNVARFN